MRRRTTGKAVRTLPYYAILSPIYILSLVMLACYFRIRATIDDVGALASPTQRAIYSTEAVVILCAVFLWWTVRLIRRCRRRSIIYARRSIYFADFRQRLRYDQFFANPQSLVPLGLEFVTVDPGVLPPRRSRRKAFLSVCHLKLFPVIREIQLEGLRHARGE